MSRLLTSIVILAALLGGAGYAHNGTLTGALQGSADTVLSLRPNWSWREEPYVRSAHYRKCRKDFGPWLNHKQSSDRVEACECYDKTVSGWPDVLQENASYLLSSVAVSGTAKSRSALQKNLRRRDLSNHERQVTEMNLRSQNRLLQERANEFAPKIQSLTPENAPNPFAMLITNYRVHSLLTSCRILSAQDEVARSIKPF